MFNSGSIADTTSLYCPKYQRMYQLIYHYLKVLGTIVLYVTYSTK